MDWGKTRPPPTVLVEIVLCGAGGMAGITILNQKYAAQLSMATMELAQRAEVVGGIFMRRAARLHLATMDDQKRQQIHRAMTGVFEFLALDFAGNRSADRGAFQRLQIRHLIDTNHPIAIASQALGVGVTPQHLLGPRLELCV